jgi:ribosome biogenesis GTPase
MSISETGLIQQQGIVASSTRRFATIFDKDFKKHFGQIARGSIDLVVGDFVQFTIAKNEIIVEEVLTRKNCLRRAYAAKSKDLVANVDLLLIVTAPEPLFNTNFLDRVLVAADEQQIPTMLIMNKIDLTSSLQLTQDKLAIYKNLGIKVLEVSALNNIGLDTIKLALNSSTIKLASFVGVSGVGKSTLLKKLIPTSQSKTGEVSEKTGQGKQVTSQAEAYILELEENKPILVDLPGVQNFGISYLDESNIRFCMGEMRELSRLCKYPDCSHRKEPNCAVLNALNAGTLAKSRYQSYLGMLEEIASVKQY